MLETLDLGFRHYVIFDVIGFIAFKINVGAVFPHFYGRDCKIRLHYHGESGFAVGEAVFFTFGGFLKFFKILYKLGIDFYIIQSRKNVFPFFLFGNDFVHKFAVVIFLGELLFFRNFGNRAGTKDQKRKKTYKQFFDIHYKSSRKIILYQRLFL